MPFDPQRPLVFMHVAKTSGTALSAGLLGSLAPRLAVGGFDRVMFGGFKDFRSLTDAARATIIQSPAALPPEADFIHGHFSLQTTRAAYPQAQFITVLREPRVRLLSLWRFWRDQTPQTMQGWGDWTQIVARSHSPLADFLRDPVVAFQTDNMALRMLLWPHPLIPEDGFIDPAHDVFLLEQACCALRRFDHLDIVENPRLADDLRHWLGRGFDYAVLNKTGHTSAAAAPSISCELSEQALDRLDACCRLDLKLWELVVASRMPGQDRARLSERTLLRTVAQYARVAARVSDGPNHS